MKTNLAVIGAGYWGKNLVRNFHALSSLKAVCDNNPDTLEKITAQYPGISVMTSPQDALMDERIQGIVISTPAVTHADLVEKALNAGKDVFVEKPLALNIEDGRRLVDLSKKKGRILMVGHLLWYHPAIRKLANLIQSGELGRIQYIYSNRLNLGKIRREENILWSFAPHDISVILGLVGEMPESVEANGGNFLDHRLADVTVSLFSFKNGVKAHLFVSWLHPFKEQKLVVVGDKKMAVFDDVEKTNKLVLYPHTIHWENEIPLAKKAEGEPVGLNAVEPLREECNHFLQCIKTRQRPLTDGEEGLRVLYVLNQCQEALEKDSK